MLYPSEEFFCGNRVRYSEMSGCFIKYEIPNGRPNNPEKIEEVWRRENLIIYVGFRGDQFDLGNAFDSTHLIAEFDGFSVLFHKDIEC